MLNINQSILQKKKDTPPTAFSLSRVGMYANLYYTLVRLVLFKVTSLCERNIEKIDHLQYCCHNPVNKMPDNLYNT